ncbi:hypothetical protein BV20DRAFT_86978 [Pilatotrama ljubarskyi]|nr:hypothetical protein BV20DRAFT_86978 [Pilatotrama ljubarskyi]
MTSLKAPSSSRLFGVGQRHRTWPQGAIFRRDGYVLRRSGASSGRWLPGASLGSPLWAYREMKPMHTHRPALPCHTPLGFLLLGLLVRLKSSQIRRDHFMSSQTLTRMLSLPMVHRLCPDHAVPTPSTLPEDLGTPH